jgi:hypothetical protein
VHGCRFVDNEMGILTANFSEQTLEVSDSEFAEAPQHQGQLHHLLYVGAIGKFVLRGSRFSAAISAIWSSRGRGKAMCCTTCWSMARPGKASYELEFPNGGWPT